MITETFSSIYRVAFLFFARPNYRNHVDENERIFVARVSKYITRPGLAKYYSPIKPTTKIRDGFIHFRYGVGVEGCNLSDIRYE